MAFPQGVYFRATDNQTDPTNYDAMVTAGVNYPFTTAQGTTVGWEQSGQSTRDRGGAGAVELRGMHFITTPATDFRIDLPSAGSYDIRAAFGDQTTAETGCAAQFLDTSSVFATPVASGTSLLAGRFKDATGITRTSQSDWTTNNAALTNTFSTTIFRTRVGGSASGNAPIAALYIESNGGSPDITLGITGSDGTGSAGTVTPSVDLGITGGAATAAAGTIIPGITIGLAGVSATAATGTINVGGDKTIAITGNAATAASGTLGSARSKGITGASTTASCGTLALASSLALAGAPGTSSAGTMTAVGGNTDRWTPATPDVQSWAAATSDTQIWTPVTPDEQDWVDA